MEMVGGAPEQGLPGERDKDALDTTVPVLVKQLMSFSAWGVNKSIWRTFYTRSQGDPLCSLQLLGLSPRFFFGRCRIATKNEKEVGTTMRTFIGPHKA